MSTDGLRGDNYSPMELIIFDALRKTETATTELLLRKVYARKDRPKPYHASIVVNRAVTTLGDKLKINRENYRLTRKRRPHQRLIENRLEKVRELASEKA